MHATRPYWNATTCRRGMYCQTKDKPRKYVHAMSACLRWFWDNPQATSTDEIPEGYQASHQIQGFASAGRDFNPNNVVMESEYMNKSRYFCCLHMAGCLRRFYGLAPSSDEALAIASTPVRRLAEPPYDADPDFVVTYSQADDEAIAFDEGLQQAAQQVVAGPGGVAASLTPSKSPIARRIASGSFKNALLACQGTCLNVHGNRLCKFWNYEEWGEVPPISYWKGDQRGLKSASDVDNAAKACKGKAKDLLLALAPAMSTPPTAKAGRPGPSSRPGGE